MKSIHTNRNDCLQSFLLSPSYIKKKNKSFNHSFKSDVKIPENISQFFSYSLGQDIRPSIFIKAPIGQKCL
jgi:hypothetical protein